MPTRIESAADVDSEEITSALRAAANAIEEGGAVRDFFTSRSVPEGEVVDNVVAVEYAAPVDNAHSQ